MKEYVCKKPARYGGKNYFIGDSIPADSIDPAREQALVKYGLIDVVEAPEPETPPKPEPTVKPKPGPAAKPGKKVG